MLDSFICNKRTESNAKIAMLSTFEKTKRKQNLDDFLKREMSKRVEKKCFSTMLFSNCV